MLPQLHLNLDTPIHAQNAGVFISRGTGIHPTRTLESHELIFVRKGVLGIREEDTEFEVCAGETLLLFAGRTHSGTKPYPDDLSFYWVHFMVNNVAGGESLSIPQHALLKDPNKMTELYRRFLDDQETGSLSALSSDLLVMLMLSEIAHAFERNTSNRKFADNLAQRARSLIIENYAKQISTGIIADALGCDPDYLGRVFRAVYGETMSQAIRQTRIKRAKFLLMESNLTVCQIATQCGFDDPCYFRRLFRQYEGMTPHEYRSLYSRLHVISD